MRVPLIIRAPGLERRLDARPAQLIDVPPSVLHLLDIPAYRGFQGTDLFATAERADRPRFLVAQAPLARQYAVVRSGQKLIFDTLTRRYVLYDLVEDPGERKELSSSRQKLLAELKALLATWHDAQIGYYENRMRQKTGYPPILVDSSPAEAKPRDTESKQ